MNVAVLGAGRVGSALGRGLAAAGHTVRYALRDPSKPLDERVRHPNALHLAVHEAIAGSDAVILATPWAATEAALAGAGDFGGRPLLDATNPIGAGGVLTHGHTDSGGEQVQRWAPTARVVKVFNTTGMENLANPRFGDQRALMLAAGDDEAAVAVAVGLATDLGFEAFALGPLRNARLLEPFGRTWIELAMFRGGGRDVAFGLLRR